MKTQFNPAVWGRFQDLLSGLPKGYEVNISFDRNGWAINVYCIVNGERQTFELATIGVVNARKGPEDDSKIMNDIAYCVTCAQIHNERVKRLESNRMRQEALGQGEQSSGT